MTYREIRNTKLIFSSKIGTRLSSIFSTMTCSLIRYRLEITWINEHLLLIRGRQAIKHEFGRRKFQRDFTKFQRYSLRLGKVYVIFFLALKYSFKNQLQNERNKLKMLSNPVITTYLSLSRAIVLTDLSKILRLFPHPISTDRFGSEGMTTEFNWSSKKFFHFSTNFYSTSASVWQS